MRGVQRHGRLPHGDEIGHTLPAKRPAWLTFRRGAPQGGSEAKQCRTRESSDAVEGPYWRWRKNGLADS
jgi:hypothetical protein